MCVCVIDIVRMGQTSMAPPDSLPTKALLGDYSSLYTAGKGIVVYRVHTM